MDPGTIGTLLTVIGIVDVLLAVLVLLRPIPIALLYMTLWGLWTAFLRPIAGEPIWDFVERFANIGAPLALLFLVGLPKNLRAWFR